MDPGLMVYKIYAESFKGEDHLHKVQAEAQQLIAKVFNQTESTAAN
jgi:phosphoglucomutase